MKQVGLNYNSNEYNLNREKKTINNKINRTNKQMLNTKQK